jgi:hypothetical protein
MLPWRRAVLSSQLRSSSESVVTTTSRCLGSFPDPYPDEILYSICARFEARSRYSSSRAVLLDLFGIEYGISTIVLPSRISSLVTALPEERQQILTEERLIYQHSFFPYYARFMQPEKADRLYADMMGNGGAGIYVRAGLAPGRIRLPERFRYCPDCMVEDRRKYGYCYWHRLHQLPGVLLCPLHHVWLEQSLIPLRNRTNRQIFSTAELGMAEIAPRTADVSVRTKHLLRIAKDCAHLLNCDDTPAIDAVHELYIEQLARRGITSYRGRVVNAAAFQKEFECFYGTALLKELKCEVDIVLKRNWLMRIVKKTRGGYLDTLRHVLLIEFLGLTVQEFFRLPPAASPFGTGAWVCINPTCTAYQLPIIKVTTVSYSWQSGDPIGMFACPNCGYTFKRSLHDKETKARGKSCVMVDPGPVWIAALEELCANPQVSLEAAARKLCIEAGTLKRYATRYGLSFIGPRGNVELPKLTSLRVTQAVESRESARDLYRILWLQAIDEAPGVGLTAIRRRIPAVFTWLNHRDREWFRDHQPHGLRKTRRLTSHVDWEALDARSVIQVEAAAADLKRRVPLVRVTLTAVGRLIDQDSNLGHKLNKMPLTQQVVSDLVESHEAFAIRRLDYVVTQHQETGQSMLRSHLIDEAGLNNNIAKRYSSILSLIDAALESSFAYWEYRKSVDSPD